MTEEHPVFGADRQRRGIRRADRQRRTGGGCLAMLLVVAVIAGASAFAFSQGVDRVKDLFGGPSDYSGSGTGRVSFEVKEGDSTAAIGRNLKAAGVIASVEAFLDEAAGDDRAQAIQVGFYPLAQKMSARSALDVLVNPDNLVRAQVTIPEGLTADQTVARLAKGTDFKAPQLTKVLKQPGKLGLPAYAEGDPEGFLFPATYEIKPGDTALSLLRGMVDRFKTAADDLSLDRRAEQVGLTPREVVVVASIIEREVRREQDLGGVAEVIDNRIAGRCPGTTGLLQMDSTVHFAAGDNDSVFTSEEMRQVDSPYNTYVHPGLPPGPISAPGEAALEAALSPTDKGYCYFVAVNLKTGETAFATTPAEHAANKARLEEYCRKHDC